MARSVADALHRLRPATDDRRAVAIHLRAARAWGWLDLPLNGRADALWLLGIAVVAFLVRLVPVLRGGGLLGLQGYDDGVYFGSAIALIHGVLPYRDYVLLLPPGMPVVLAPFALLGSVVGDPAAYAVTRLVSMGMGATTAVVLALTAGRYGRTAGIVAGLLYAVWVAAVVGERNPDLHAVQNLLLALGLLVLSRRGRVSVRRAAIVGIALGLATSVQLWHGITVALVMWWVLVRADGRGWTRLRPALAVGLAAVAAFTLVCLPFFLAAPDTMFRQVLVDQVGRPATGWPIVDRLRAITGLDVQGHSLIVLRLLRETSVVVAATLGGIGLILAATRALPWTRPWAVLALAQLAVVLVVPSFHADYPSFATPAASLALGSGAVLAVHWLQRAARRRSPRIEAGARIAGTAAVAVVLVAMAALSVHRPTGSSVPRHALARDLANSRCVASNSPSLLILTSTLRRNLEAGCVVVLDPTGVVYDSDQGHLTPGARMRYNAPRFQAAMKAWLTTSDGALFAPKIAEQLSPATMASVEAHLPVERRHGNITVRLTAGS